jgi:hypothetical protein
MYQVLGLDNDQMDSTGRKVRQKHFTWIDTLGLEMDSKNCFRRKQHDSQGSLGVEGYFSEIKK